MHESAVATPGYKRRQWPTAVAFVLALLLVGWIAYLVACQSPSTVTLPDGSTLTFLEVSEASSAVATGKPWKPWTYEHRREPFKSKWEPVWKRLPETLRSQLPQPRPADYATLTLDSVSKEAVWFMVSPRFSRDSWRYFWVDGQGYESETYASSATPASSWMVVAGCMPRGEKWLHLKIRSKVGERARVTGAGESPGELGAVVAEIKCKNPLRQREAIRSLSPQTLPVTVPCNDGHTITLSKAVRSRVVSQPTYGLRFEMHLDDGQPIASRFLLREWVFEDAAGTTMVPLYADYPQKYRLDYPQKYHHFANALWSDPPVWKARFLACRYRDQDFTPEEKFVVRVPVSPPLPGQSTPQSNSWKSEYRVNRHHLQVDTLEVAGSLVRFKITVSPPVGKHDLVMVADGKDCSSFPAVFDWLSPISVYQQNSTSTVFQVGYIRTERLDHMNFTFALQKVVPLEFTFRPEFEP